MKFKSHNVSSQDNKSINGNDTKMGSIKNLNLMFQQSNASIQTGIVSKLNNNRAIANAAA